MIPDYSPDVLSVNVQVHNETRTLSPHELDILENDGRPRREHRFFGVTETITYRDGRIESRFHKDWPPG